MRDTDRIPNGEGGDLIAAVGDLTGKRWAGQETSWD